MLYVVVLNYNGAEDTLQCLDSLSLSSKSDSVFFKTVVVDNCSSDSSVELISDYFISNNSNCLNIKHANGSFVGFNGMLDGYDSFFIVSDLNGGYAYGNNLALKLINEIDPDGIVFLINNDVVVPFGVIENMLLLYRDYLPKPCVVGANVIEVSCASSLSGFSLSGKVEKNFGLKEVETISGCAMFFPVSIVRLVGYIPDNYFMYFEETDWLNQINGYGIPIFHCNDCFVYHKTASSSGGMRSPFVVYYMTRNKIAYMNKYWPGFFRYMFFLLRSSIKFLYYILRSRSVAGAVFRGVVDGLNGKFGRSRFY